jgi:hypothetical protein
LAFHVLFLPRAQREEGGGYADRGRYDAPTVGYGR